MAGAWLQTSCTWNVTPPPWGGGGGLGQCYAGLPSCPSSVEHAINPHKGTRNTQVTSGVWTCALAALVKPNVQPSSGVLWECYPTGYPAKTQWR